jgi:hypothetical protein
MEPKFHYRDAVPPHPPHPSGLAAEQDESTAHRLLNLILARSERNVPKMRMLASAMSVRAHVLT